MRWNLSTSHVPTAIWSVATYICSAKRDVPVHADEVRAGRIQVDVVGGAVRQDVLVVGIVNVEDRGALVPQIRNMERKNLAVEALQKLLADEIKLRFSRNYAKDTKFSDLLNQALTRYRNGTIEAAQVIEETERS